jgi:hypothetical protein
VRLVIAELKTDKAPGPDGYIGVFFKECWDVIKGDIMAAINFFYSQHDQHFKHLNSAHIILIPKKCDAEGVGDYRPISLTHSVAKLVSKLLASRLSSHLDTLISRAQSAFIRGRSIHDNFLYTRNLIRDLYRAKQSSIFLKLDLAKAFDSVRWDYLMEVLTAMGFGFTRWRAWVTTLLATATSAVFLNGDRGDWFKHRRGLRHGDPLSPLLFIIAMELLQRMLDQATSAGLLSPIQHKTAKLRISLYADDAAIFLNPIKEEVATVFDILSTFGHASGLVTNPGKSAAFPIRCEELDVRDIMQPFGCPIQSFPCKYLGLSLHLRQLRRVDVQPLIDKLASRLPSWKGRFLDKAGRLRLLSSVLTSIPTYFLTIFP